MSEDLGVSPQAGPGHQPTASAASASSQSGVPDAVRTASRKVARFIRARRRELETEIPRLEADLAQAQEIVGVLAFALSAVEAKQPKGKRRAHD